MGPTGDGGWEPMNNLQDGNVGKSQTPPDFTPSLVTGPGGALLIPTWNRAASLDLTLPESIDLSFRVHSSQRPDFGVALGGNVPQALRIETWDNALVLVLGDQFQTIKRIEDTDREVALHVLWDKKARTCSVYTPEGNLITSWQTPETDLKSIPGLIVQNKGLDLSLDFLRIKTWDGKPPAKIDLKQPHAEVEEGQNLSGEIMAGPPGFVRLQAAGQTAPTDLPIGKVDALVFSSDLPQTTKPEATLLYADGTLLFGHIESVSNGQAAVATSFSQAPLTTPIDLLRQLRLHEPVPEDMASGPPLKNLDTIHAQDTTLHGKLECAGDTSPRWTPVGGTQSSRPSQTLPIEITRALQPGAALPDEPALFYLRSGDVLPGKLNSLDRTGAEFESDLMAARKLPANELNAIQFGAPTRIDVHGFGDPGWIITKGDEKSVRRTGENLQMDPGTAIAYPSLLQGSEFSFKYPSTGFSATRLRLFATGTDGSHAMSILLGNTGNQFVSGLESGDGQFENQGQIKTKPGEAVSVRIKIDDNQVEIFANDVAVQRFPIDPAKSAGSGLIIEPASMWGNGSFPISLSNFSVDSVPGRTWVPEVSSEIKTQALTVPRFQKDDPPRHLLLAANGDVLRGEIEAATPTHFGFRCGLENLNVPRDRVKAVIWLQPVEEGAAPATTEKPESNLLDHRLEGRITFNQAGLNNLISFLKGQDHDLKFKLPEKRDPRRIQMLFSGQTVGEALAVICSRFDLHYRLDTNNTIVLEPATPEATEGLVSKTYWLKPDSVPKTPRIEDLLTTKGVTFPTDASVQWQPEAGLLLMINTAENQAKLTSIIESDFGGSMGSPTYWLQLTCGARLALAVDKFEKDFITGHNPVYGACTVPMSQVYIIRNSAPEPTTTIKSLQDWQLVAAPEPVIPGTGGESSPLLGKDAPGFKLPLLNGGNFDLAAEKGHVVVLDFWASWCGPCVQSLPGLIQAVSAFPENQVKLIGVNQGEGPAPIKHFLEARGLKFTVAMDADQSVGQKYGVDAIPHTVIVGADGKIAWEQTGYSPEGETEASDIIKHLLEGPSAANASPTKETTQ